MNRNVYTSKRRYTMHDARHAAQIEAIRSEERWKIDNQQSSTDGGSPLTESPSLHGVHPNCSESLSSSQSSPPPLFPRSPESPSLSPLTVGSHPLIQDQFLFGQSGGATTRDDPTTRVPPHWIEDPAAAPRYRKPADHWTSRRYSLLSSFRPLPPLFSSPCTFTSRKKSAR